MQPVLQRRLRSIPSRDGVASWVQSALQIEKVSDGMTPGPKRSGGCFGWQGWEKSSPECLGKILMLYDMHIIYLHQECTIYQKTIIYIHIIFYIYNLYIYRHAQTLCFLWCSNPVPINKAVDIGQEYLEKFFCEDPAVRESRQNWWADPKSIL